MSTKNNSSQLSANRRLDRQSANQKLNRRSRTINPAGLASLAVTALLLTGIAGLAPAADASVFDDGVSVMTRGDLKGAVTLFNQAIAQDETNWNAFLKRGQCLYQMGDFNLAATDFGEVVKMSKTTPDGYFWRANSYSKVGKFSLATQDYVEVVKLAPNFIADHTLPILSASASAAATASSAMSTSPVTSVPGSTSSAPLASADKPVTLHLKAAMFGGYKDPENEITQLSVALSLDPLSSKLMYQRARAYIQAYKYQSALSDLNNAILAEPNNASYYLARAFVYHKEGQEAVALQDIKQAQFVDPGLPTLIDFATE